MSNAANPTKHDARAIAGFPPVLQDLIKTELAAGNGIVEISSGFPAPPVGACARLANRVTTRPRISGKGIVFYERNNSDYSGEFTDAKGFFFVLEPPNTPGPERDMDAIRAEREARQREADVALLATAEREAQEQRAAVHASPGTASSAQIPSPEPPLVERFCERMIMNYERWHDGTGYALDLLQAATPEEQAQIEELLTTQGVRDWRDAEALAALGTPRARQVLRHAFDNSDALLRMEIISHAPDLFTEEERTGALVSVLETEEPAGSLTQAMLLVESYHPPRVIQALLHGVRTRDGATAGEFAMMLLFIHDLADSPYDMALRPFILRFQDEDRERMYRELCERLGVPPAGAA